MGYKPRDPLPVDGFEEIGEDGAPHWRLWRDLGSQDVLRRLPLLSSEVSVSRVDVGGKVSFLTNSVAGSVGNYVVVLDFIKYRIIEKTVGQQIVGYARVGVGLRVKAQVATTEANVNLGGLLPIGLAAEGSRLRGSIAVEVIGIDSKDVANLLPITAQIDETSIQMALQALAAIKTRMYDEGTQITPHLVAVSNVEPGWEKEVADRVLAAPAVAPP